MPGAKKIPLAPSKGRLFLWPDDNRPVPPHIRARARRMRQKRNKLSGTRAMLEAVYRRQTDRKKKKVREVRFEDV